MYADKVIAQGGRNETRMEESEHTILEGTTYSQGPLFSTLTSPCDGQLEKQDLRRFLDQCLHRDSFLRLLGLKLSADANSWSEI